MPMTVPPELRQDLADLGLTPLSREAFVEVVLDPTKSHPLRFLQILVKHQWHMASYVDVKFALACVILPGRSEALEAVVRDVDSSFGKLGEPNATF
jgi:hypothetical protein